MQACQRQLKVMSAPPPLPGCCLSSGVGREPPLSPLDQGRRRGEECGLESGLAQLCVPEAAGVSSGVCELGVCV